MRDDRALLDGTLCEHIRFADEIALIIQHLQRGQEEEGVVRAEHRFVGAGVDDAVLDCESSIDFVMIDTQRELAKAGWMKSSQGRYHNTNQALITLKEYIIKTQIAGRQEDKELCRMTLDYLYTTIPNGKEHAIKHLQIQKMDLQQAEVFSDGQVIRISPQVTGAAEEVVKRIEKSQSYEEQNVVARLDRQYKDADNGRELSLLNRNHNGIITGFGNTLKQYLTSNERWATLLFNTIMELAKDEMAHNFFNADYAKQYFEKTTVEYHPNISPRPSGIDYYIKEHGRNLYQRKEEDIIQKYLLNEESLVITGFDLNEYDISVLCHLANCGLPLSDEKLCMVIKAVVLQMIQIWQAESKNGRRLEILDAYDDAEVVNLLKTELLAPERTDIVLDLLFSEADYSYFVSDTYEFYEKVLTWYLPHYFDAYNDAAERRKYQKIVERIDARIQKITDEYARIQLYRVLFLLSPEFYFGDWSTCKTTYSFSEKQFICSFWEKYGQHHLNELLTAIYELHIDELLPSALPALGDSFRRANETSADSVKKAIYQNSARINEMITTAFIKKDDQIKQSNLLSNAFESLLEVLIDYYVEIAAVILDEFRIH